MKKGTRLLKCPCCGVHTGTQVPVAMTRFGIMAYDTRYKDNIHRPVFQAPMKDLPRGYWCNECWEKNSV